MLFGLKCDGKLVSGIPLKDVIYHIENGTFPIHCLIFDNQTRTWQKIHENQMIRNLITRQLMEKKVSFNYDSLFHHWTLKNYVSTQGSFSKMEIIHKLQKNEIKKDALIRHPTMKEWTAIEDVPVFSDENIRALYKMSELNEYFVPRQAPRTIP